MWLFRKRFEDHVVVIIRVGNAAVEGVGGGKGCGRGAGRRWGGGGGGGGGVVYSVHEELFLTRISPTIPVESSLLASVLLSQLDDLKKSALHTDVCFLPNISC